MGAAVGGIAGGLMGAAGGLLGQQKEGGKNAGNIFYGEASGIQPEYLTQLQRASMQGVEGFKDLADPTKQVQDNAVLGQLFGPQGTLGRTAQEEQQLSSQGFQLTPEDRTAYGQASGDIARLFGEQEQSLAQSLANRGLSNSGAAGAAFTGLQGNKMEQLAKAQQQIAQQRYQDNLQRLGQTRNFLSQLGQQGAGAIQDQFGRNVSQKQNQNQAMQQLYNMARGSLQDIQGQNNESLQQEQQTQHQSGLSAALSGGMQGAMSGASVGGALSGGGAKKPTMAGSSYSKGGVFA